MLRLVLRFFTASMTLALGACAFVDSVPVIDGTERGFAYPVCYPFLKVVGADMTVVMVPNPNKLRAAQFGAFLAKNDLDVTFGQCGPEQMKADMDSTAAPIKLLELLTQVKKDGALFATKDTRSARGQTIQIFEFVFAKDGGFVGLRPLIRREYLLDIPAPGDDSDAVGQAGAGGEKKVDPTLKPSDPLLKK